MFPVMLIKKRTAGRILLCEALIVFASANVGWIDPLAEKVDEGNRMYGEQKYSEAQKKYQDAQTIDPESPAVYYNLADALYKQEQYDDAEELYNKVLDSADKKLKADALHNLGNVKVKKNELGEALKYYRQSIRLDPSDKDTRINYEYALRMLQQQEQEQQQQENQDQEQDQQDQQNQDQQQNQEQQQQQQNDESDNQQSQQQEEQQQDQEQQTQQDQQQKQNAQQQKQPLTSEQLEELKEKLKPDENIEANPYLQALEKQEFEKRKQKVYGDAKLFVENDW